MIAPLQNADCLFLSGENPAKVGYVALAVVEADKLIPLSKDFLAAGYHLEDVSGLVTSDGAVSVYHFDHFDIPGRATVLVIAPLDAPSFPSIADVYQCAEWHERETRDFFGFQYEGNPNFIPLLLSEDMVDVHPLLKDEGSLASLASMFSSEGREREIVKQADGFTLLDAPVAEEPAPAEAPAVQADAAPAPKAEAPKAEPAPEAPKAEAAPEAPKVEEAPKSEPAPASEAPKEAAKSAPAAEKKETPEPQAEAPVTPEAKPESEPKPVPESKPEPRKAAPKDEAKAAPKKVQGTVKKGKVVKSGKKGAGNA